jgi:hypothetical protein
MKASSVRRRAGALTLAVATFAISLPSPCAAAEETTAAPARSLTTLSPTSRAMLRHADQAPPPTTTSSAQFFKTKKGAAVLVLIGAGFGYTLYSRFHDEIKSPIREQ